MSDRTTTDFSQTGKMWRHWLLGAFTIRRLTTSLIRVSLCVFVTITSAAIGLTIYSHHGTTIHLTDKQTELLAERILENTAEHDGWRTHERASDEPEMTFSWVLLPDIHYRLHQDAIEQIQETRSWVVLSETPKHTPRSIKKAVIRQLREKYAVYFREEDIPERFIERDGKGQVTAYRDGFSFSFEAESEEKGKVLVSYRYWTGMLGGSSYEKWYQWNGANWIDLGFGDTITVM